jgi:hypothetical protein
MLRCLLARRDGICQSSFVYDLSWRWIGLMAAVPPVVGVLVAIPCWRQGQMILGNLAGTAVIFSTALGLILREHVELDVLTHGCLDAGVICWPEPSAFMRYAIYASIGMIEVFVLFAVSLKVERMIRNRHYAPEWR